MKNADKKDKEKIWYLIVFLEKDLQRDNKHMINEDYSYWSGLLKHEFLIYKI
jgi:hypothetical protein